MMDHSKLCLSSHEIQSFKKAVLLLKPFEEVTKELSSDKYVSISKVITLVRRLQHLTVECVSTLQLKQELVANMRRRFLSIEENDILAPSTLLDPRFKEFDFRDSATSNQAVQRMTTELAATIQTQQTGDVFSPEQAEELQLQHNEPTNIWSMIDERVAASISTCPPTSNSIVTLHTYLVQPKIKRIENPLMWWKNNTIYPFLSKFAKKDMRIPGTSVPAERVFSKAGEHISRSAIKPKHVNMLLFLNTN